MNRPTYLAFFMALGGDCASFWPHFKMSLKSYFYKSTGSPVTQTLAEGVARSNDKKWGAIIYLLLNNVGHSFFNETQNKMLEDVHTACWAPKRSKKYHYIVKMLLWNIHIHTIHCSSQLEITPFTVKHHQLLFLLTQIMI